MGPQDLWTKRRQAFPEIKLTFEKMLVTAGGRSELVMSGASTSWQDLVLYLVARQVGYPTAHALSKFFAMQWHAEGQAPFIIFAPPFDHGDKVVLQAQHRLQPNYSVANPVRNTDRSVRGTYAEL